MAWRIALVLVFVLGCQTGGDPLAVSGDPPAACETPQPVATAAPVADAGAPPSNGLVVWFSNGVLPDMVAAGVISRDYDVDIGGLFSGYVSYGMDVVTLHESGRIAAGPGIDWTGPPTVLFMDGRLAQLVWDGMTKAVVTTTANATVRESPQGRVHCELSNQSQRLECAFRGVVRVEFR
jgi:hypothetical protein